MESHNKTECYYKVFLFEKRGYPLKPVGSLEIKVGMGIWNMEGQFFQGDEGINRGRFLVGVVGIDGREIILGKTRLVRGGHGKFYLRSRMPMPVEGCRAVQIYPDDLPSLNFLGILNCPKQKKRAKPGEYLWSTKNQDFPRLLERMMEKVESITEKVSILEQRRAMANSKLPTTIRQVEPFRPPLRNYKWWHIG